MNVDVIPVREVVRDRAIGLCIRGGQVLESGIGKNNAPTKRVVGAIPFINCNVVLRILFLEQQRQVEARRAGAHYCYIERSHHTGSCAAAPRIIAITIKRARADSRRNIGTSTEANALPVVVSWASRRPT